MSVLGDVICDVLSDHWQRSDEGRCEFAERIAAAVEAAGRWIPRRMFSAGSYTTIGDEELRTVIGETLNRETSLPFKDTVTVAGKIEAAIRERCKLTVALPDATSVPEVTEKKLRDEIKKTLEPGYGSALDDVVAWLVTLFGNYAANAERIAMPSEVWIVRDGSVIRAVTGSQEDAQKLKEFYHAPSVSRRTIQSYSERVKQHLGSALLKLTDAEREAVESALKEGGVNAKA